VSKYVVIKTYFVEADNAKEAKELADIEDYKILEIYHGREYKRMELLTRDD
jgi:hypothetical protein